MGAPPPLCPASRPPQAVAACLSVMVRRSSRDRDSIYGGSVWAAAERAAEARNDADRIAVAAWNKRMLAFQVRQPSPTLGDALNAGYGYLEPRCLGCDTNQTVALDIVRRPKATRDARTARRCGGIPTSAAIWWRCRRQRSARACRPRRGCRVNDKKVQTREEKNESDFDV
jgi:hypothetical protein